MLLLLFSRSVMSNSATPWTAARQASLSITNSQGLHKLMSTKSVMPSNHLILCHPLLLLPSIFPSIKVFPNESALRKVAKALELQFQHQSFQWYPGLISFRIDWLDLLSVQGNLKSLLQHHSSNASILQCSAFFKVKLSHPYMTTRKPIGSQRVRHDWVMSDWVANTHWQGIPQHYYVIKAKCSITKQGDIFLHVCIYL